MERTQTHTHTAIAGKPGGIEEMKTVTQEGCKCIHTLYIIITEHACMYKYENDDGQGLLISVATGNLPLQ